MTTLEGRPNNTFVFSVFNFRQKHKEVDFDKALLYKTINMFWILNTYLLKTLNMNLNERIILDLIIKIINQKLANLDISFRKYF